MAEVSSDQRRPHGRKRAAAPVDRRHPAQVRLGGVPHHHAQLDLTDPVERHRAFGDAGAVQPLQLRDHPLDQRGRQELTVDPLLGAPELHLLVAVERVGHDDVE
jgi:hypothetical protein